MKALARAARGVLEALGLMSPVRRVLRPFWPAWRAEQAAARRAFAEFLGGAKPVRDYRLAEYPESRRAIVMGYATPSLAKLQTSLLIALRMAGYKVSVVVGSASAASADFYLALGAAEILETETMAVRATAAESRRLLADVTTSDGLLALQEEGVLVGKFAASTLMRAHRISCVDPADPATCEALVDALTASRQAAQRARHMVAHARPELVCFYDRGYTPDGELFEVALAAGACAITWNVAHKSGSIIAKRYGLHNKDVHFGMPSPTFWETLRQMPWTPAHWYALQQELETCYSSGLWYDEVGTQTNKRILDPAAVMRELGLDPEKPTAVIFPHLFWDATFFWGTDLFADYREWFVETLKIAAANPALNWIVKTHPANLVKNHRDNYVGEFSEILAIREAIGDLPSHITLMLPDSPVSTLSLFGLMDYCLTVRGTVGLEAAIFGKQVLTAGTGRYDGLGFTVDFTSRAEYLECLGRLQTLPLLTPEQTELARRYAFGLFLQRPLEVSSAPFEYAKDAGATLTVCLNLPQDKLLDDAQDLRLLADWLVADALDDLVGCPKPAVAFEVSKS